MYWDANASSSLRPVVREGVGEFLSNFKIANPSSIHSEGRKARALLRQAREAVCKYLFGEENYSGARIIFTSGGTEACNALIDGFLRGIAGAHMITSEIEHPAIKEAIKRCEREGFKVSWVGTDREGVVKEEEIFNSLNPKTELVSLMFANNVSGVIQPVERVVREIRKKGFSGVFVSDGSQAFSKSDIDLKELFRAGVDAVSLSGHKMGALSGVGAVVFNTQSVCREFQPVVIGGGQEDKLRGGTEFLLGIYSLGLVCKELVLSGKEERERRRELSNYFRERFQEVVSGVDILTPSLETGKSLDNTLFVRVVGVRADDLVVALDIEGLSVSVGSACSSGKQEVSNVALEIGLAEEEARECFRISFDWDVSRVDIDAGVDTLRRVISRMRGM